MPFSPVLSFSFFVCVKVSFVYPNPKICNTILKQWLTQIVEKKKIFLITFLKVLVYYTARSKILGLYIIELWQALENTIAPKLYVQQQSFIYKHHSRMRAHMYNLSTTKFQTLHITFTKPPTQPAVSNKQMSYTLHLSCSSPRLS